MVTSAAVLRLRDPLCFISPSPLTPLGGGGWGGEVLFLLSPALPNTSMQGLLKSGVQQHKDQGYSGAASLPSADRKGLMRRGHSSLVIRNNAKNYFCVCSYGEILTLRPTPPHTQTHKPPHAFAASREAVDGCGAGINIGPQLLQLCDTWFNGGECREFITLAVYSTGCSNVKRLREAVS